MSLTYHGARDFGRQRMMALATEGQLLVSAIELGAQWLAEQAQGPITTDDSGNVRVHIVMSVVGGEPGWMIEGVRTSAREADLLAMEIRRDGQVDQVVTETWWAHRKGLDLARFRPSNNYPFSVRRD